MAHQGSRLALLCLCLAALPAQAQDQDMSTVTMSTSSLPSAEAFLSGEEFGAGLPIIPREQAEVADTFHNSIRYPLLADGSISTIMLRGENGRADFKLVLPNGESPTELRIAYRNSIDVLSETSSLRLIVNGVETEPVLPMAFDELQEAVFRTDALIPGTNSITVEAKLAHRIFCGPDASFALWLEIDPTQSGVISASSEVNGVFEDDIAARLIAQIVAEKQLTLRVAPEQDEAFVSAVTERFERILSAFGLSVSVVSVFDPLVEASQHDRVVLDATSGFSGVTRASDGAAIFRVNSANQESLNSLLTGLSSVLMPREVEFDLPQAAPGTTKFADLGQTDFVQSGRYLRHDVPFRLPEDWLLMGAENATLRVLFESDRNLPSQSRLGVKVNGQNLRTIPLGDRATNGVTEAVFSIPIRDINRGGNALTFEAFVPGDPPDQPCPVTNVPTLRILASSEITFPDSPAFHYAGIESVLPDIRSDAIDIFQSGGTETLNFTPDIVPPGASAPRLTIVPYDKLSEFPLSAIGLDQTSLASALADRSSSDQSASTTWSNNLERLMQSFIGAFLPGDGPISDWLSTRTGTMAIAQLWPAAENHLVLFTGPSMSESQAKNLLRNSILLGNEPKGQFSIQNNSGVWQSWSSPWVIPRLEEGLTIGNVRTVISVYATWAPGLFVAGMLLLALLSVVFARTYIVQTRERRR